MARHPNRFLGVQHHHQAAAATINGGLLPPPLVSTITPLYLSSPQPSQQQPQQQQQQQQTYKEESTRVQLQRQRLREHHANALVIPGFKTSAAFFASLRTNLRLGASPPPSPMSTPPSMRGSATSLPPPSPLSAPADLAQDFMPASPVTEDPLAGVPELKSYRAEKEEDKIAALKLVADSVAQMRQIANNILIQHPANLAAVVAVLSLFSRYMYDSGKDVAMIMLGCVGLLMAFFAICRFSTEKYLHAAEDIGWEWLGDADVLVTKFGDEIIGTAIIDWVSGEARQKRKKVWRGEIKGWTVRMRYRNKGVGSALLQDAVNEAKSKGAEGIDFAEDHANSLRILPAFYSKPFDKRERKAEELLQDLFEASPNRGKRK